MILGSGENAMAGAHATLDDLFRRAGVRHPERLALADPPNRAAFTDGAPRNLTYAQADRAIARFAGRLRELGLASDTVVGLQLPNTVESTIALLGVLRAGMIAAPLPLLWNAREMVAALGSAGARAIVTCARVGPHAKAAIAAAAAADLFPIRHVCGFGAALPDGVVPLDDVSAMKAQDTVAPPVRPGPAAAHVAAVTFEVTRDGVVPVARNHMELIAGGLAVFLEAGMAEDADIVSTIPPASFAGMAVGLLPWLNSGGTLHLLHGFDADAFAAQSRTPDGATMVLPGPAVAPLHKAGLIGAPVRTVIALRRAPQRFNATPDWRGEAALVDVAAFGEIGIVAGRRDAGGNPLPLPHGLVNAPRGATGGVPQIETVRTSAGTLAVRGLMVPSAPFPPGAAPATDDAAFWDTGFTCRRDGDDLTVTGPPAGTIGVGGYRLGSRGLEAVVAAADPAATIVALPDALMDERLAGASPAPEALRAELEESGINPLISGVFRPRGKPTAA